MVSSTAWFFIVSSWVTVTMNIILAVALLRNFLIKKTTGTLILFSSYLIIGLGATFGAMHYTGEILNLGIEFIGIAQTISTIAPLISTLLIYIFSCRHILRDSEIVKSLHLIIISILIGCILMIYLLAIFRITPQQPDFLFAEGESPLWYQISKRIIPNTSLYNLSVGATALFNTPIQIYLNMRIIIRAFILSRRTDKIIRKRGLQLIGSGLIIYLVAGMVISLELSVPWADGSVGPTIFWTLRKFLFLISYIILYLGWIMPDWLRRRIRGKTWFEMQYKTVSK